MNSNYLIGRQPILNRAESIVGYELLFRSKTAANIANVEDASQVSANVIIKSMSSFGLESILGPHRGFINLELEPLETLQILEPYGSWRKWWNAWNFRKHCSNLNNWGSRKKLSNGTDESL